MLQYCIFLVITKLDSSEERIKGIHPAVTFSIILTWKQLIGSVNPPNFTPNVFLPLSVLSVLSAGHKSWRLQIPCQQKRAGTASAPPGMHKGSLPCSPGSSRVSSSSAGEAGRTSRGQGSVAGQRFPHFHLYPQGTPVGTGSSGHSSWCRSCCEANLQVSVTSALRRCLLFVFTSLKIFTSHKSHASNIHLSRNLDKKTNQLTIQPFLYSGLQSMSW